MAVGLVYDPVYLKHDTGDHVENAGRLTAIVRRLEESGLMAQLTPLAPRPALAVEVGWVHSAEHITHIQAVADRGGGWLDGDTVMSAASYEAALYAAGGAIVAIDAVMEGRVDSAFALVRPPGHHATPQRAMGFCLFNNVAIAAEQALRQHGLERVLIIDFDVHHGNGTQEVFYGRPEVMYVSTHEYPFYPGSGGVAETGQGAGQGATVNIPLPAGCGDGEYRRVFEQIIVPASRRFGPQLLIASAGYDGHWADDLAMMQLSVSGFYEITRLIRGLADELCGGRVLLCLEGGYNLSALAASVAASLDVLLGNGSIEDPLGPPRRGFRAPPVDDLIAAVRTAHDLA